VIAGSSILVSGCETLERWLLPKDETVSIGEATFPPVEECDGKRDMTDSITVTVHGSPYMDPSTQYCFVVVEQPSYWCGGAQSFGPGDHTLAFSPVPDYYQSYELVVGLTQHLTVASNCQIWRAKEIEKFWNDNVPKKCVNVHYDCMQSYDIRYGGDLEDRLDAAFGKGPAYNDITLQPDNTTMQDRYFEKQHEFVEWLGEHWLIAFFAPDNIADLFLGGIRDFWSRTQWYPDNSPFNPEAAGYTLPPTTGHILGDRGCASVVFFEFLQYRVSSSHVQAAVLQNATHELGHGRAGLTHAFDATAIYHDQSAKCVMDKMHLKANDDLVAGYEEFCDSCLVRIQAIPWP
jgi:hypothetical protein